MNIDELKNTVASIQEQYNNLSNPDWVSSQLQQLKGKFDILNEVILREESNVKDKSDATSNSKK